MARKKSVTLTQEDVLYAVGGALAGMAANKLISKALVSQPEGTKDMAQKAVPALKLIGGGYFAMKKGTDRKMRFAGLGVAATGAMELGNKFAPEYFGISGTGTSDLYVLGNTGDVLELPITPDVHLEPDFLATEEVLGMEDDYLMEDML